MRKVQLYFPVMILLLSSCSGQQDDVKAWMRAEEAHMKANVAVEQIPEMKQVAPVVYSAANVIDPFSPLKIQPERKSEHPDTDRQPEPLEEFELNRLSMVGIVKQNNETIALVLAEGSLYPVTVGNHMGLNYGVITEITETEITLKELVEDVDGNWVERANSLLLQGQ